MTDEEREELERDVDLDEVEALLSRNNMMLTAADREKLSSIDLQELDDITSDDNMSLSEKDLKKIIIEGEDDTTMIDPKELSKAKTFEDMSLSEKDLKDLGTNPQRESEDLENFDQHILSGYWMISSDLETSHLHTDHLHNLYDYWMVDPNHLHKF